MKRLSFLLAGILLILSFTSCALIGQDTEEIIEIKQVTCVDGEIFVEYEDGYVHALGDARTAALEYTRLSDGTYEARLLGSPVVSYTYGYGGNGTLYTIPSQNAETLWNGSFIPSNFSPITLTIDYTTMSPLDIYNIYYIQQNALSSDNSSYVQSEVYGATKVSPYFSFYDLSWMADSKTERTIAFEPIENPTVNGLELYLKVVSYRTTTKRYGQTSYATSTADYTVAFERGGKYYAYYSGAVYQTLKSQISEVVFREDLTVSSIPDGAFLGCTALTELTLPDSVTSVGDAAFATCTALERLSLPANLSSVGNGICHGSSHLRTASLPASALSAFFPSSFSQSTLQHLVINGGGSIPARAFSGNKNLKTVVIADSITSIGEYAFFDCISLESVTVGNGVQSIGDHAFSDCTKLKSVTVGDGIQSIADAAFYNCSGLRSLSLPAHMNGAYTGGWGLSSIAVITYR